MLAYAVVLAYESAVSPRLWTLAEATADSWRQSLRSIRRSKARFSTAPRPSSEPGEVRSQGPGVACTWAGDLFASVPRGGDLYFLCSVVHDWDDERAVTILRNCREAMFTTGRLLLLETVVLENDSKHFGKIRDLNMMAASSGRERTRAEFCTLLTASGFRMSRNIPTMAPQNLIEAVPQ
jgi:hypothetical protein